jgi:hypothetical protein
VDECEGCAVFGAVEGDGVAVAVGDLAEPGFAVFTGFSPAWGVEVACEAVVGVGDCVVAPLVAGEDVA